MRSIRTKPQTIRTTTHCESHSTPILALAFVLVLSMLSTTAATGQHSELDATDHVESDIKDVVAQDLAASPYNLKLSLSYDESSGNTNTRAGSANFELQKFWDKWGLATKASVSQKEDVVKTEEKYDFDLFVSRRLRDNLSLVLLGQWQRDVFKGLDQQLVIGLGFRWDVIDREGWDLTFLGAPAWSREEFTDSSSVQELNVVLLELRNSKSLSATTDLSMIASYYASLEDSEDYRFDGEIELETAINSYFAMGLEYTLEYDHLPAAGRVTTDKTFTAYLSFKWAGKPDAGGSDPAEGAESPGE